MGTCRESFFKAKRRAKFGRLKAARSLAQTAQRVIRKFGGRYDVI